MGRMRLAAAVILYHPNEKMIPNMQSYLSHVEKVYVLDNTERPKEELVQKISSYTNIQYIGDGENKGIATRLNTACRLAIDDGFELLLTMDQDSYFDEVDIAGYISCIASMQDKKTIAMFGIEYIQPGSKAEICKGVEAQQLITSGSILNLLLYNLIGGFDEALFIDEVDLDFCYNAITRGFKIVKFENIFLNHTLGDVSLHKSFKNLKSTPRTLHSPLRIYYMIRNFLYVNAKYKNNFYLDKKRRKKALLNRLKNNLLYGKKKPLIIKYILEALFDYRTKKMGKKKLNN